MKSIEDILGLSGAESREKGAPTFSFLLFSDVRKDIDDKEKYRFMKDIAIFGDQAGFEAIYLPERHFHEFGSIYANPAIAAAYLIGQTNQIRLRTAGISLPLHHPAEIVEWWAMNDVLSGGRVDLGFGSGWNKNDFIYKPDHFHDRRKICSEGISLIQRLWRGEKVSFAGPNGDDVPIVTYPRPIQKELRVWLLVAQNDEAFIHAGRSGYNIFTMLYGIDFETLGKKIKLYRNARRDAGLDPDLGTVSLMLHTMVHKNMDLVREAVETPFKDYISSALEAHVASGHGQSENGDPLTEYDKAKMLEYSYERYFKTAAIFGTVEDASQVVDKAVDIGVDDIACLLDFGVDYEAVRSSFGYLSQLIQRYR